MVLEPALRKLVKRFIDEPDRITPADCRRLLESIGFSLRKNPGSENIYHKKGFSAINVPTPKKGKYVKSPHIKRLVKLLDLEILLEEG